MGLVSAQSVEAHYIQAQSMSPPRAPLVITVQSAAPPAALLRRLNRAAEQSSRRKCRRRRRRRRSCSCRRTTAWCCSSRTPTSPPSPPTSASRSRYRPILIPGLDLISIPPARSRLMDFSDHRGGPQGQALEEDGHGRRLHAPRAPRRDRRQGRRPRPRRRAPRLLLPLQRVRPSATRLSSCCILVVSPTRHLMLQPAKGTGCTSLILIPRR